jgi:hypothetical protein
MFSKLRLNRPFIRRFGWFTGSLVLYFILSLTFYNHVSVASDSSNSASQSRLAAAAVSNAFNVLLQEEEHRKPVTFNNPARTIDLGLHVENIHQLSLKDKVYSVEGWYWLNWPEAIQTIIEQKKIPVKQMVEFTNQIEDGNMVVEPDSAEPIKLPDNRNYQLFRFSGRFYVDDLDLRKSPFQTISLPVTVEARPDELSCYEGGPPCVQLKPTIYRNDKSTVVGQFAEINGFESLGVQITPYIHKYNTNFGIGAASSFGAVDFTFKYKANPLAAFTQNVLPLLVIIAVVLASPSLPSSMGDVRLAIPTTALLTLIFLQMAYRSEIPPLSYVTFLDWLYIYTYVLSIIFFVLYCWGTHKYSKAAEDQKLAAEKYIDSVDYRFQMFGTLAFLVAVPLAWFLT